MNSRFRNRILLLIFCLFLPVMVFANPTFVDNKDYVTLPSGHNALRPVNGNVTVMEFFSIGCPWCYRLEPDLEAWLATRPPHVNFVRVPVVFETGWDVYAKSYYVAKQLGVANKMLPILFNAVQRQQLDLTNEAAMQQIFANNGVSAKDFQNAYEFSPGIDAQLARGNELMTDYLVYQIPTIVIDGKYKIDSSMTGGDNQRMFQTVDYLVQRELGSN